MDTPTREHLARQPLDFYPTPSLLTWALLGSHRFVPWRNKATVLEPCNGEGAISDVLKESGLFRLVDTADIDETKPAALTMDAADPGCPGQADPASPGRGAYQGRAR